MVFGRQLRDFLPVLLHKYELVKDWSVTQEYRERTLAQKRESDGVKWAAKTEDQEELTVRTSVAIQNQSGRNPNNWDKTGVVLENRPNSQGLVMVDGSRILTLRNRRFVRLLNPTLKKPKSTRLQPLEDDVQRPEVTVGANTRNNHGPGTVGRYNRPMHNTRDDSLTEVEDPVNDDVPDPLPEPDHANGISIVSYLVKCVF
jgi:hypothetical protein